MSNRTVEEGVQPQGVDEEISYTLTTTAVGSTPTTVSVKVYDQSNDYTDVTATVMPTGSPSVVGDVITLPALKLLTLGRLYRVEVKYTVSGNIIETWFTVLAERYQAAKQYW